MRSALLSPKEARDVDAIVVAGIETLEPQTGDVLFGSRNHFVEKATGMAGGHWMHTAMALTGSDTVEVGGQGCFSRPIDEFTTAYHTWAVARPAMPASCIGAATDWAVSQLGKPSHLFSHQLLTLAGLAPLALAYAPRRLTGPGTRSIHRLADLIASREPTGTICSSFIWDVLQHTCAVCRPRPDWPLHPPTPFWRRRASRVDAAIRATTRRDRPSDTAGTASARATRLLVTPSDLWQLPGFYAQRVVVGANESVLIVPHASPSRRQPTGHGPGAEFTVEPAGPMLDAAA